MNAEVQAWSLTVPPSVNNLYANTPHGRRKTSGYRSWLHTAGWELRAQHAQPVEGAAFSLSIAAPINHRRDLGNILKATEDLLVELRLLPDDRWIDWIELKRVPTGDKMWVTLRCLDARSAAA